MLCLYMRLRAKLERDMGTRVISIGLRTWNISQSAKLVGLVRVGASWQIRWPLFIFKKALAADR